MLYCAVVWIVSGLIGYTCVSKVMSEALVRTATRIEDAGGLPISAPHPACEDPACEDPECAGRGDTINRNKQVLAHIPFTTYVTSPPSVAHWLTQAVLSCPRPTKNQSR